MGNFNSLFGVTHTEETVAPAVESVVAPAVTEPVVEQLQVSNDGQYECESVNVFDFININKSYGDFKLFENLNLAIKDFKNEGQFITFIGQSGCGKTQLLKMIAGISKPDSGTIKLYGNDIKESNTIPMVFQQYSSFEWMTVLENVALPMKLAGIDKKTREEKAMQLIKLVFCLIDTINDSEVGRINTEDPVRVPVDLVFLDAGIEIQTFHASPHAASAVKVLVAGSNLPFTRSPQKCSVNGI